MIQHIKISNIKGLKECYLLDLGRVNIICGKNNSGKSTLLEGISLRQCRSVGHYIKEDLIDFLYEKTYESMGWANTDDTSNRIYRQALSSFLNEKKLCFRDESGSLTSQLEVTVRSGSLRRWAFGTGSVKQAFETWIRDLPETVLIPPKRELENNIQINNTGVVESNGKGVLNRLFEIKNQREGSAEREFYNSVNKAFFTVSSGYTFDIFIEKENRIRLCFAFGNKNWVNACDSGMGLMDLLVILYFSLEPNYPVVLIEEPESHIHPDMQRKLLLYLRNDTPQEKQFFISTHSNVFLNGALVDRMFVTHFNDSVTVSDATSRALLLNEIGYSVSDNLVADLVVLTEGPSDKPILEEFLLKMGLLGKYDIKIWPLGGDIMSQLDMSLFQQSYKVVALVDSDPGSAKVRSDFIKMCEGQGIEVHKLKRYAIENYFSVNALREVFKGQIPDDFTTIDPKRSLEKQIGINVKRNNQKVAKAMSLEEIKDTDLFDFLASLEELCSSKG